MILFPTALVFFFASLALRGVPRLAQKTCAAA